MGRTSNLVSPANLARTTAAAPARLNLLRTFDLTYAAEHLHITSNAQRLLAFLALENRAVSRTYIAGNLWIDAREERASGNLRSTLWRLSQQGAGTLVETTPTHVKLASRVHVDYWTTAAHANELVQGRVPASAVGDEFLDDLLPDWYDEWVIVRRERYRQLRLQALDALCDRLTAEQRYGDAVRVGLAAVAAEPLRESAHRVVVGAHIAEGNFAEALRHYETYKSILSAELGLEPSGRMMALLETIRRS